MFETFKLFKPYRFIVPVAALLLASTQAATAQTRESPARPAGQHQLRQGQRHHRLANAERRFRRESGAGKESNPQHAGRQGGNSLRPESFFAWRKTAL